MTWTDGAKRFAWGVLFMAMMNAEGAWAQEDPPAGPAAGLPEPLKWETSPPLVAIHPVEGAKLLAIKDPTVVRHDGNWHIYATTVTDGGKWGMVYLRFADWADAAKAEQTYISRLPAFAGYHCAPHVFYFEPQKKWYLVCQSQQPTYRTTDDLSKPETWTPPKNFFAQTPKSVVQGWIDYWVICDDTHAYLFFSDDHGRFYRSRTTLEAFPEGFDEPVVAMQESNPADLFEGASVYRIKGTKQYLAIIECAGPGWTRYFRSFVADSLDGDWRPLAASWEKPFAGLNNVVGQVDGKPPWSRDISHGELIRDGADQTMTLDPQNLQLLYQGLRAGTGDGKPYHQLPYELGLLRPAKP